MLRPCSAAVGTVLSRILVVPICYGPSRAAGSSNYIEIGQSSNWLRTDRGAFLNVGASTQGTSRCHGSSGAGARGTSDRCDQKTRHLGLNDVRPVDLHRALPILELAANGSRRVFERRRVDAGNVTLPWIEWGRRPGGGSTLRSTKGQPGAQWLETC